VRSPALHVELTTDRRLIAAMLAWLGLCGVAVWAAHLPAVASIAVTLGVALLAWPVVHSQLFGLQPRAPVGLACNDLGQWSAYLGDGSSEELELSSRSRVFPGMLLLLFRGRGTTRHGRHRWMVLASRSGAPVAMRRLRVRVALELARRPPAGWLWTVPERVPTRRKGRPGVLEQAVATTIRPRNNLN
jgi:hypothetical protein